MENPFRMNQQNKILCISFGVFLILYFFINKKTTESEKKSYVAATEANTNLNSADTFIPAGYVLVPIQIDNGQNVSGFIDAFALVDLYASTSSGGNALIAEKIKLIRAPLNPSQFAVLATEYQAKQIMQINTAFWVVLQNRNSLRANLEKNTMQNNLPNQASLIKTMLIKKPKSQKNKIEIEYYDRKRL